MDSHWVESKKVVMHRDNNNNKNKPMRNYEIRLVLKTQDFILIVRYRSIVQRVDFSQNAKLVLHSKGGEESNLSALWDAIGIPPAFAI